MPHRASRINQEIAGKCFIMTLFCHMRPPFCVIAAKVKLPIFILEAIDAADQAPWRRLL
jgi:hypothetical protein